MIRAYRLAGVLATCLLVGLAIWLAPLEPGVVALQFAVTPTAFGKIVHAWSPQDLERYRAHLPVDTLLALAYGGFGLGWVRASPWFASMGAGARRVAAAATPPPRFPPGAPAAPTDTRTAWAWRTWFPAGRRTPTLPVQTAHGRERRGTAQT